MRRTLVWLAVACGATACGETDRSPERVAAVEASRSAPAIAARVRPALPPDNVLIGDRDHDEHPPAGDQALAEHDADAPIDDVPDEHDVDAPIVVVDRDIDDVPAEHDVDDVPAEHDVDAPIVEVDRDVDDLPDEEDRCPDLPEDRDALDDIDGCPEPASVESQPAGASSVR